MNKIRLSMLMLAAAVFAPDPAAAQDLLPSEATTLMVRAMQHRTDVQRTEITRPLMARMQTEDLAEIERYFKAEAHFINFQPEEARDGFLEFSGREDDLGRVATQRLMIIRINAFGMVDELLESDIPAYRSRFGIDRKDRYGISYPIMQTAMALVQQEQVDRALDLILDEVRLHDRFDAPYFAYRLLDQFMEIAQENGRGDEFKASKQSVIEGLDATIEKRLGDPRVAAQRKRSSMPGSTLGTMFEDEQLDFHQWTAEFIDLRNRLKSG